MLTLMRRLMAAVVVTGIMFGTAATLVACNTVQGVGEDIEAGGERLQDAADDE